MIVSQHLTLDAYNAATRGKTEQIRKGLLELYFEAQVRANMVWLSLNPKAPLLYQAGVEYVREGSPEVWLDIPAILKQGHDDCEGLAAWLAAEMRLRSPNSVTKRKHPLATVKLARTKRAGLWHAVVQDQESGVVYDPSKRLGMGRKRN
jgi:hypothetical protein